MNDGTTQITWQAKRPDGTKAHGIMNSVEPLSAREWRERMEIDVARALDVGEYELEVAFGYLLREKWHAKVERVASITPF